MRACAMKIATDVLYVESLRQSKCLKHNLIGVQRRTDYKMLEYHALLMHHIMLKKLREAGGLLAFTKDLVAVVESTMLSYV